MATTSYADLILRELAEVPANVQREVLNYLLYLKHGAAAAPLTPAEVQDAGAEPFPGLALSESALSRYWNDPREDEAWKDL